MLSTGRSAWPKTQFSNMPRGHRPGAGAKPKPKIVAYTLTKGLAAKFLADQLSELRMFKIA